MQPKRIVITGAPGTGKTAVIDALEASGFFCFHEIIRKMTAAAKQENSKNTAVSNPLLFVKDPMAFNTRLLQLRKEDYNQAKNHADIDLFFYDRGMPDVLAYMDYFNQNYPKSFMDECKTYCYDTVFIMPPWREIYSSDNERLETFEEAEALDKHLSKTYEDLAYNVIIVPKTTIANRVNFILNTINSNS